MNFVLDPVWTTVFAAIAIALGMYLKNKETFKNRWIPIVTAITTFIGQVIAAATAQAGFLDYVFKAATIVQTIGVWLATTGAVSVFKNTVLGKTGDAHK